MGAVIEERHIVGTIGPLSKDEEQEMETLLFEYRGLVSKVAKGYTNSQCSFDDLAQEGYLGLIKAYSKFDESLGCRFSTYATYWVKHYISRYVAKYGRLVRLPIKKTEVFRKIMAVKDILVHEHGAEPTLDTIASYAEMSVDEVKRVVDAFQPELSFETPLGQSNSDYYEVVEDKSSRTPEMEFYSEEMCLEIKKALDYLIDKEREIIQMRFGLDREENVTLKEIADEYQVSAETVRQIEKRAICKLRTKFSHLKEYITV